jgi:hypothetical protein
MTPVISHLLWSLRPQFPILVWHVPCPKKSLPTCNLSARPVPCFGYKEADMTSQRFTFVNVTAPQDASSAGNKKRIRSAAAASGWAQGLRPKLPQTQLNASENPRFSYAVDLSDLFESSEKSIFSNTPASIDKQDLSAISENFYRQIWCNRARQPFTIQHQEEKDSSQQSDFEFSQASACNYIFSLGVVTITCRKPYGSCFDVDIVNTNTRSQPEYGEFCTREPS